MFSKSFVLEKEVLLDEKDISKSVENKASSSNLLTESAAYFPNPINLFGI